MHRETRSLQINRAYYTRGRTSACLPPTINEDQIENNYTEGNGENFDGGMHGINGHNQPNQQQITPQPLQRRFFSANDVRIGAQSTFQADYTVIDMDFDDSTDDHINAITANFGSNLTIADP